MSIQMTRHTTEVEHRPLHNTRRARADAAVAPRSCTVSGGYVK
ncbi:hypothetical protein [Nocardia sp. CNY236]|nr:hypothetical protein [Nocardia sp. CNY236]